MFNTLGEAGVGILGATVGPNGTVAEVGADLTVAITSLNEVSKTDAGIFIFS